MDQAQGIRVGNAWGTPVGLVVPKCVYSQHLFVFKSRGLLSSILGEEATKIQREDMTEKAPQQIRDRMENA